MTDQAFTFRVVGPGRAGRSFANALGDRGAHCVGLLGRNDNLTDAGREVDAVIIAVPDPAIGAVADAITPTTAVMVHVSGATTLEPLSGHHRRASVHPLLALPDPIAGAARLTAGATFAVAGDPVAARIVDLLGGTAIEVDDRLRPLYHATAAVAANHLVALCAQVERLADRVGVPVSAYWELMAGSFDNVQATGAEAALTGPAARGDRSTIAAHLAAIGPEEQPLYLALSRAAAALAGRPDPTTDAADPDAGR